MYLSMMAIELATSPPQCCGIISIYFALPSPWGMAAAAPTHGLILGLRRQARQDMSSSQPWWRHASPMAKHTSSSCFLHVCRPPSHGEVPVHFELRLWGSSEENSQTHAYQHGSNTCSTQTAFGVQRRIKRKEGRDEGREGGRIQRVDM